LRKSPFSNHSSPPQRNKRPAIPSNPPHQTRLPKTFLLNQKEHPTTSTHDIHLPSTIHNQPHPHKSCIFTISWAKIWEFPKTISIGVMKQRSSNWYQWCYYARDGYSNPAYLGRLPSALKRQTLHACSCHISLLHAEQRLSLRLLELLI